MDPSLITKFHTVVRSCCTRAFCIALNRRLVTSPVRGSRSSENTSPEASAGFLDQLLWGLGTPLRSKYGVLLQAVRCSSKQTHRHTHAACVEPVRQAISHSVQGMLGCGVLANPSRLS